MGGGTAGGLVMAQSLRTEDCTWLIRSALRWMLKTGS